MGEYTIVHAPEFDELIALVNERIGQGWQPLGGVCFVLFNDGTMLWAQAMTYGAEE